MLDRTELIPVTDGERRRIGPVDCQFIPVTHSVPHGFAIAFFTPAGTIIHSGDFKLDLTPVDGRRTNLALLGDIAEPRGRGAPAHVGLHERRAARASRRRSRRSAPRCARCSASTPTSGSSSRASRRTSTGCSRSRRPRSRTAARSRSSAVRCSRTSRWRASAASSTFPTWAVIDIDEAPKLAPGEVCIVCTGSQGEPMSALSLMAAHEHKHVKISPDDVVVISAHAIPGNESNVSRVIDSLHRAGAEVVHDRTSPVHVSGHASQEELKFLLNLLEPEWFVPVHGEYRHLVHHAQLARDVGVAADRVLICEDGDVITLDARRRVRRAASGAGRVHVRRRDRRRHRPRRAPRPAGARRGGRRRRDRHGRHPGGRGRHRSRDRDARLGLRARGRGPHRGGEAGGAAPRSTRRSPRARSTSTRCAATPAVRSASSSTSGPGAARSSSRS